MQAGPAPGVDVSASTLHLVRVAERMLDAFFASTRPMEQFDYFVLQLEPGADEAPRVVAACGASRVALDAASFERASRNDLALSTPQQVVRAIYEVLRMRAVDSERFFELKDVLLVRYQPRDDVFESRLVGANIEMWVLGQRMFFLQFDSPETARQQFLKHARVMRVVRERCRSATP